MGSLFLAKSLARGLGVPAEPGCGLDYHLEGAAIRPRSWQSFKQQLDRIPFTTGQQTEIVDAAVATMQHLHGLYESCDVEPEASLPVATGSVR